MKSTLFALLLLASATAFAGPRVVIGVGIGGPAYYGGYYAPVPAPPPIVDYEPPYPGPGYSWVDGYWSYAGPRRFWTAGYWAPPVYGGYYRGGYYGGGYYGGGYSRGYRAAPRSFGRPEYRGYRR